MRFVTEKTQGKDSDMQSRIMEQDKSCLLEDPGAALATAQRAPPAVWRKKVPLDSRGREHHTEESAFLRSPGLSPEVKEEL